MRAAVLGLALAWLAPLGQAEKLPVETFFKDPEFSRMRLSPDGKWLAAIAPREGKNNLLTIRLSDRKLFGCTAEDENEVYSFNWISNERMIATISPMAVFMLSTVMAPSPRCSIRPSRLPVNLAVACSR